MMEVTPAAEPMIISRTIGNVRWRVLFDWEATLLGPQGLRSGEWLRSRAAHVVRDRGHRAVYYVELADRAFFVKHDRSPGLFRSAGHFIRGSSARRQWTRTLEVLRRGVPTARPVAWGEQVRGGLVRDSYFITEAIPEACPLDRCLLGQITSLPAKRLAEVRRRIIGSLARFVAAVHQAGIRHNDLHAGNVLVRLDTLQPDSAEQETLAQFYLIDLAGVRFSGPLDWPASRDSLVVLNGEWFDRWLIAERWRFWRTYLAARPGLDIPDRHLVVDQLDRGSREYSRRIDRGRDKRSLRTNRDFLALRNSHGKAHGVRDLAEAELARLLERPEVLLWQNLDRPIKLGHGGLIVEAEIPLAHGPVHVVYKRCRLRNWLKAVAGWFRRSRALRGWYLGHALLSRRIATPRPLAVCEPSKPRFGRVSYLATEWIERAENLHLWGWRLAECPLPERLSRAGRCAESLGRLIGRMHARHLAHRDLKGSNLLVAEQPDAVKTYLVDLDGLRIHRRLATAGRVVDLARLATSIEAHPWVTNTLRCRFLRAYARQFPRNTVAWKPLWHRVSRRSSRLIQRKRRRGEQIL